MKSFTKKFFALVAIIGLLCSGCSWAGNKSILKETQDTVSEKIIKGQTTKQQVHNMFGDPIKTEFNAGGDLMWTYKVSKAKASFGDSFVCLITLAIVCKNHADEKNLVVLFDSQGIVKNFDLTISDTTFSTI